MKKLIFILATVGFPFLLTAQNYNPYVLQASITPTVLYDLLSNGSGTVSFTVGNDGSDAIPLVANQEMLLTLSLSRGIPNHINPIDAIQGNGASYFTWQYDAASNTYLGTQNQVIPANTNGTITVQYKVNSNSQMASPQNGFNVNITPPAFTNGPNTMVDDQVSLYTWTDKKNTPVNMEEASTAATPNASEQTTTNTTTPTVSINDFSANVVACNAKLSWEMKGGETIVGYKLSRKASTETSFKAITELTASRNNKYSYVDALPENGKYEYKVEALTADNKIASMKTQAVFVNCHEAIMVYPNPMVDYVNIKLSAMSKDLYTIQLSDAQGKVLLASETEVEEGTKTVRLSATNLSAGVYHILVKGKYESKTFTVNKGQ